MTHVVQLVEEDGELILPLPSDLLEELSWGIGDQLTWKVNDDGTITLTKDDVPGTDVVYG